MSQHRMTQIQVRIDMKTKNVVRDILEDAGLDMSTAIKMFCKQIERTRSIPLELNGCLHSHHMSAKNKGILKAARQEARNSKKSFSTVTALMDDLYS